MLLWQEGWWHPCSGVVTAARFRLGLSLLCTCYAPQMLLRDGAAMAPWGWACVPRPAPLRCCEPASAALL